MSEDIAWLAGYLDGEGSFCKTAGKAKWHYPKITVETSDKDNIMRVSALFGAATCGPKSHGLHKQTWYTAITGKPAIIWMEKLYPYMGERRRAKIIQLITEWKRPHASLL